MGAAAVPAIIGAVGSLGGALIGGKGKPTQYTNAMSPQAQGISDQMAGYIRGGMNKPVPYANVNPMAISAMDMISRMFMGQGYSQPNYGMSAQGGGPTGMGMPPQMGPQYPPGMPQGMGQGMGQGFGQPGMRQFYGPRGMGQSPR